jgi:glutathione S-transferase
MVWETLAICEYCAELSPVLWPADRIARAHARAIQPLGWFLNGRGSSNVHAFDRREPQ